MITKALLMSLLVWIGSHTSYDVSHVKLPRVEYHPTEEIENIYYGDCARDTNYYIKAAYSTVNDGTLYLNDEIDQKKKEDVSTVVHELFHHVQYSNPNKKPKTSEGREKETIMVENKWRKEHGLKMLAFLPSREIYACR